MSEITLYYSPGACSRVTLTALEEIGLDYGTVLIDLSKKAQKADSYRAINPNAEVPALQMQGRVFTQNPAILYLLSTQHPDAHLLPPPGGSIGSNQPLEDLMWCASTLHVRRRQIANPLRLTNGEADAVSASGVEAWQTLLEKISKRVADRPFWYGDTWSIVDAYVNWAYSGAAMSKALDLPSRPAIVAYQARAAERPSARRALAREQASAGA